MSVCSVHVHSISSLVNSFHYNLTTKWTKNKLLRVLDISPCIATVFRRYDRIQTWPADIVYHRAHRFFFSPSCFARPSDRKKKKTTSSQGDWSHYSLPWRVNSLFGGSSSYLCGGDCAFVFFSSSVVVYLSGWAIATHLIIFLVINRRLDAIIKGLAYLNWGCFKRLTSRLPESFILSTIVKIRQTSLDLIRGVRDWTQVNLFAPHFATRMFEKKPTGGNGPEIEVSIRQRHSAKKKKSKYNSLIILRLARHSNRFVLPFSR